MEGNERRSERGFEGYDRMPARLTGALADGRILALAAGLATFITVIGAAYLWTAGEARAPWLTPALFGFAGLLSAIAGAFIHRVGMGAPRTEPEAAGRATPAARHMDKGPRELDRLQVDSRGRKRLLPAGSIDWIEAAGNYSRLHVGDESFLYRMSLGRLVDSLEGTEFIRVHKSAAVNLNALCDIDSMSTGDAMLRLASGAQVRMSRRYARQFHVRTGRPGGWEGVLTCRGLPDQRSSTDIEPE